MNTRVVEQHETVAALLAEIERYLRAVEAFRALGCEPNWGPEQAPDVVDRIRAWLEPCEQGVSGR